MHALAMSIAPSGPTRIIHNSGLLRSKSLQDYVNFSSLPSTSSSDHDDALLPLIDLEANDLPMVAAQVAGACRDWGFFQVRNHGMPLQLLDRLRARAHSLFELPLEQKQRAATCAATNFYGYGVAKARTYFPNAWMEAFDEEWTPVSRVREHVGRIGLRGADYDDVSGVVEEYAEKAEKLAVNLTELVAQGLGLEETTFSRHFEETSTSTIRMNYYPPCPQPSLTFGIPPHSDFNIFTILLQDAVPGLQVLKDNEWVTVKPSRDALVVNVGDAFQAWSNRRIKSVMHRALVNMASPRLSVVYFFGPHPETLIEPPRELVDDENPLHYRPFDYKEMVEQILVNKRKEKKGSASFVSPLQSFLLF